MSFLIRPLLPKPQPWLADEDITLFANDDDEYWIGLSATQIVWSARIFNEDEPFVAPAVVTIVDEDGFSPVSYQTFSSARVWQDEDLAPAFILFSDDEGFVPAAAAAWKYPAVYTDDDAFSPLVVATIVDEDGLFPGGYRTFSSSVVYIDDDAIPAFILFNDEDPGRTTPYNTAYSARTYLDDDVVTQIVAGFVDDESIPFYYPGWGVWNNLRGAFAFPLTDGEASGTLPVPVDGDPGRATPGRRLHRDWWRVPNFRKYETEEEKYARRIEQGILVEPEQPRIEHALDVSSLYIESIKYDIAVAEAEIAKAKAVLAVAKRKKRTQAAEEARQFEVAKAKATIELESRQKHEAEQALEELDVLYVASILAQD